MHHKSFLTTIIALFTFLSMAVACTPSDPVGSAPDEKNEESDARAKISTQIEGSSWKLQAFNAADGQRTVQAGSEVTLTFADGQVNGHASCNRYFGSYTVEGNTLSMGPLGATRMMCEKSVMDQETAFLEALGKAQGFVIDENGLTINLNEGDSLTFSKQ